MDINELERSGQLFEGWHVVRLLGEGGFGTVYEIEREEFGVKMRSALKVISIPKSRGDVEEVMSEGMDQRSASNYFRGYVEELSSECSIMLKLKGNSNVVSFEDYKVVEHTDEIGWDILIRMEMLTPLIEHMKNHNLSFDNVMDIGISMCEALSLCKKHNIMHRDLKPANIFVSDNGDYKLGDFGISRIVEKSNGASTRVGTIDYIAPEIFRGEKYDSRVDIYSLGLVLYRLLNNNRLPFLPPAPEPISQSQREAANMQRVSGLKIPKPAGMNDQVYRVISKAAAFNPDERYQDPAEFCVDLKRIKREFSNSTQTTPKWDDRQVEERTSKDGFMPPPSDKRLPTSGPSLETSHESYDYKATEVLTPRDEKKPSFSYDDKSMGQQDQGYQQMQERVQPHISDDTRTQLLGNTQPVPIKKKNKLPVVLAAVGGVFALFVLIIALGSGGSTNTSSKTLSAPVNSSNTTMNANTDSAQTIDQAKDNEEAAVTATKQGKLIIQSDTILKGDTVNTQYIAGGDHFFYADNLVYTSSDESVATVRRSKDQQRYVIEGKSAGEAVITGTYGEYSAEATIRVIEYGDLNVINEMGYLRDELYQLMVNKGLSASGKYEVSTFGKTQIPFDIFGLFDIMELDFSMYEKNVYYYSSENLRLGIDLSKEGGSWVITITDLGGYPTEGELTVLITDISDQNAFGAFRIPVKVE